MLRLTVLLAAFPAMAGPVVEVVVVGRGLTLTPAMRGALPKDAKVVDLSAVSRAIYFNEVEGKPFADFTAPPPEGGPGTLDSTWRDAMATCRKAVPKERFACSVSIMSPLWQACLDTFGDPWVTEVQHSTRKGVPIVEAKRYRAQSTSVALAD